MATAKDIILRPIPAKDANELVKRVHYSGKVVQNSQLHIGVFLNGKLEGAMQFGPSLDKRKIQGLVADTQWHEFIELNRMAFTDALPRNSESRAIAIAIWTADDGSADSRTAMTAQGTKGASKQKRAILSRVTVTKGQHITDSGAASMQPFIEAGYKPLPGYQLRYIYFIDPTYRQRLNVPELPYSEIDRLGAGMYKGEKRDHAGEVTGVTTGDQPDKGSSTLTHPLTNEACNG